MDLNYKIYSLSSSLNNDSVRYIGLTKLTLERRLKNHLNKINSESNYRCSWIKSVINSGGKIEINLLEDNLSLKEANEKEIHYIKLFKSFGARLVNATIGGSAIHPTLETRIKMSKSRIGKINSIETRNKISAANTGKKMKPESILKARLARIGKKRTEEQRLRIIAARKDWSAQWNNKPIIQFDLSGNKLSEFPSTTIAAKQLGFKKTNINNNLKGLSKHANGFIWKYKNNINHAV